MDGIDPEGAGKLHRPRGMIPSEGGGSGGGLGAPGMAGVASGGGLVEQIGQSPNSSASPLFIGQHSNRIIRPLSGADYPGRIIRPRSRADNPANLDSEVNLVKRIIRPGLGADYPAH